MADLNFEIQLELDFDRDTCGYGDECDYERQMKPEIKAAIKSAVDGALKSYYTADVLEGFSVKVSEVD